MKKVYIPLMIVAVISLASCHKTRTCTCTKTTTYSTGGSTPSSTEVDTWERATKHEASTQCMSRDEVVTYTGGSSTTTYDCKLN